MLSSRGIAILSLATLAILAGCRTRQRANIEKLEPIKAVQVSVVFAKAEETKSAVKVKVRDTQRMEDKPTPRGLELSPADVDQLELIEASGFELTAEAYRMAFADGVDLGAIASFENLTKINGIILKDVDEVLAVSIAEGISPVSVADVLCMTVANGLPVEKTVSFFSMAHKAGVPMVHIVALFRMAEKEAVLARLMPILEMAEGKTIATIIKVFMLAEKQAVPMGDLIDVFQMASASKIPVSQIAEMLCLTDSHSIPISDVLPIFSLAQAQEIRLDIVLAVMRETIANGLPMHHIVDISAIAQRTKIPPETVMSVYKELIAQGISTHVAFSFLPLLESLSIQTIDVQIGALAKKAGVSLAVLRIAAMKAILAVISHTKPVSELAFKDNFIKSRWEMVSPEEFSRLWEIKRQAEELEAQGQNTDALWHEFWNVFLAEEDTEEQTTATEKPR